MLLHGCMIGCRSKQVSPSWGRCAARRVEGGWGSGLHLHSQVPMHAHMHYRTNASMQVLLSTWMADPAHADRGDPHIFSTHAYVSGAMSDTGTRCGSASRASAHTDRNLAMRCQSRVLTGHWRTEQQHWLGLAICELNITGQIQTHTHTQFRMTARMCEAHLATRGNVGPPRLNASVCIQGSLPGSLLLPFLCMLLPRLSLLQCVPTQVGILYATSEEKS